MNFCEECVPETMLKTVVARDEEEVKPKTLKDYGIRNVTIVNLCDLETVEEALSTPGSNQ